MKIAYFDCFAGAGGDMIIASMLDAGLDRDILAAQLASLGLDLDLKIEKTCRCGIAATRFDPQCEHKHHHHDDHHQHHHRHLPAIIKMIEASSISAKAKDLACRIFQKLGQAEARVHGIDIDKVHFHEVGAADSIADIVGACIGFDLMGFDKVFSSPLAVGGGTVKTQHGILPVPAPATLELIKDIPITTGPEQRELLTPTAAAILTTVVESFGPMPEMTIQASGYGAGTYNSQIFPNVLRLVIGNALDTDNGCQQDTVVMLETNLDDVTGELAGHVLDELMSAGALDAYCTPIYMKQNRPAYMLSVICQPESAAHLEQIIFSQGLTLGIRKQSISRSKLERSFETIETPYGPVTMKLGVFGGKIVSAKPEFADCRRIAAEKKISVRQVQDTAASVWHGLKK